LIPPSIPTSHPYRTLVVCFDGTGDQFDTDNSNIVEFFGLLKKDDPNKQLVYYQAGIGSYTSPQIATPFFAKVSKLADEAVAWDLDTHIMGGYEFLMQNYRANDKICIFGFSRGSYTARCLAGMIHKVGLLPISNNQQIPFAYKMYTTADEVGWKQSNGFKKTFSIDVDIEFVGVWDTVNSVGLIPRRLPFTTSNTVVSTFRHAVSLDERRAKFKANLWNRPQKHEELLSISDQKVAAEANAKGKSTIQQYTEGVEQYTEDLEQYRGSFNQSESLGDLEGKYGRSRATPTDVDEVWFIGCHCDVGGGSVDNGVKPCTARIALRWMIRECFKTNSGILFNTDDMKGIGLDPASLYPVVLPRPPAIPINPSDPTMFIADAPKKEPTAEEIAKISEQQLTLTEEEIELQDALAPIYDVLATGWAWWILEVYPLKYKYQTADNQWHTSFKWNLGAGRHIPSQSTKGVRVHRSVKTRLDAHYKDGRKYFPKANLDLKYVTWVD
jgi:uncharacterized protein (DUF2235 family)